MTLEEAKRSVGKAVVYQGREDGTIISMNRQYVFVRYVGDIDGAKATRPEDLTLRGTP